MESNGNNLKLMESESQQYHGYRTVGPTNQMHETLIPQKANKHMSSRLWLRVASEGCCEAIADASFDIRARRARIGVDEPWMMHV